MAASTYLSPDDHDAIDKYLRLVAMGCESSLLFWESNLPDPQTRPITRALVNAYILRQHLFIDALRDGLQGMLNQRHLLSRESSEIGHWLRPFELHAKHSDENENLLGDYLVSKHGFSYSHVKEFMGKWSKSPKGAPNKRARTLEMLDARAVHGWSYQEIAIKMCDCSAKKHTPECRERIRQEIEGSRAIAKEARNCFS